ncbi:hypothetical protein Ancab_031361 [Ancistrocladus abbreviatus]
MFTFAVTAATGLDLPAETGLSDKVVLKFGGVSRGKTMGIMGSCGRTCGLGELGREKRVRFRPLDTTRPVDAKRFDAQDEVEIVLFLVGVERRELDRLTGDVKLAGLELWDNRALSVKESVGAEQALDGLEGRDVVVRAEGRVEGFMEDDAWAHDGGGRSNNEIPHTPYVLVVETDQAADLVLEAAKVC